MIKEALYRIATKAEKETRKDDKYYCPFCFCSLIKRELRGSSYLNDFLKWEEKQYLHRLWFCIALPARLRSHKNTIWS